MFRSAQHDSAIYKKDSKASFPGISSVQFSDVDLLHLKHRLHDSFDLDCIFVMQHLDQRRGNNLPGQSELVFEPTALRFLSAISAEFLPEIIDFFLRVAVHDKRNRFIKFEHWAAVERCEFLAFELELDSHDRSRRSSSSLFCRFAVAGTFSNLRIFENRGVKLRRLLGLIIEPQKGSNLLHRNLFLCWYRRILLKFRNRWIHLVPRLRVCNENIHLRPKPARIIKGPRQDSHKRRFLSFKFASRNSRSAFWTKTAFMFPPPDTGRKIVAQLSAS